MTQWRETHEFILVGKMMNRGFECGELSLIVGLSVEYRVAVAVFLVLGAGSIFVAINKRSRSHGVRYKLHILFLLADLNLSLKGAAKNCLIAAVTC